MREFFEQYGDVTVAIIVSAFIMLICAYLFFGGTGFTTLIDKYVNYLL